MPVMLLAYQSDTPDYMSVKTLDGDEFTHDDVDDVARNLLRGVFMDHDEVIEVAKNVIVVALTEMGFVTHEAKWEDDISIEETADIAELESGPLENAPTGLPLFIRYGAMA